MRSPCWRALVLYAVALSTVTGCRCKSDEPGAGAKTHGKRAASADLAPEPDLSTLLRCGDFLTSAEIQALGLDASKYQADYRKPNEGLGVTCQIDKVTVSIFHGASFDSMREGARNGIAVGMLGEQEGPKIGRETIWTTLAMAHTVTFWSTGGRFAANITGNDKALVEKLARTVEANMEKQK
jgi:hypothetical protein